MNLIYQILRFIMKVRYGTRGGLKPPLNYGFMRRWPFWYRWQVFCWKVDNKLYTLTGLPEDWMRWVLNTDNAALEEFVKARRGF